jgi:hypothetical protein
LDAYLGLAIALHIGRKESPELTFQMVFDQFRLQPLITGSLVRYVKEGEFPVSSFS